MKKIIHLVIRNMPGNSIRVFLLKLLGAKIKGKVCISQGLFVFDARRTDLLTIEDSVGIGPNVTLVIHSDPYPSPLEMLYKKKSLPIHIKRGVWIGACATIMGGVTIGEFSIVGAGAVVNRNVPSYSIVAGVPARIIKQVDKKFLSERL